MFIYTCLQPKLEVATSFLKKILNTLITFRSSSFLVIALCPQTLRHIRGGWLHLYTNTSEPVDGNGD
jgi:hypothetical protein